MRQHFILCGLGKVGWRVLDYLRRAGEPVTVIDTHCSPGDARLEGVTLLRGDCRQPAMLEKAGLAEARGVIVLTSDDLVSLSTALMVRHLHPTIRIVVRMFNEGLIKRLGDSARNIQALSTSALAAPLLAMIAQTGKSLGMLKLQSGANRQITELTIAPQSGLVGRRLDDIRDVTIVAHLPDGQSPRFIQEVDASATLNAGDRVIVFGDPATLTPLIARGENESLPDLLWAGLVRRTSRVLYRVLGMIDLPVKICTALFLSVILVGVLVFSLGMNRDSPVDAFYRTISLITTGADMRGDDVPAGSWQKAFITVLRLFGLAMTAAFTAIFTNYLIRANLGAALEIRRIPESGHIVVCGLGNIGFRVVEELHARGEPVVVIEQNPNSPFIATTRRLGVAVIIGNAAVAEVLRQARSATARAVVAATSNELLNLEIALLVRESNPRQRVVVRVTDPHLALTLRQAANVRLALSIPELSAPAFVASVYENRIHSLFQVEGRVLAAIEVTITDDQAPLYHRTLQSLRTDFGFLPVQLCDVGGCTLSFDTDRRLAVGDHLTGIIALEDVHRLFQMQNLVST